MDNKKESNLQSAVPAHAFTGKQIISKLMAALILYLGFSPLYLLPGAFLEPKNSAIVLVLPLIALLLTGMSGIFTGKHRRIGFLVAILLQAFLCAWIVLPMNPLLLLLPCLAMMLLFLPAMAKPPGQSWSASRLAQGIVLHLIGQAVKGLAAFANTGNTLSLFFSGYLLICLFSFNRYALMDAAKAEQSPPAKLLDKNRRILACLSLTALLLANLKSFAAAALAVWDFLKNAFATILLWLLMLLPQPTKIEGQGTPSGFDPGILGGSNETGAFSLFLEKVLTVLAVVVSALLMLFALYQLFRLIKKLLKKLLIRIREYTRNIGEGYVDKTESLLDVSEVVRAARDRWVSFQKRHKKPPALESLSPRDKVRRIYALLAKRLKSPSPSLTAREVLQSSRLSLPPARVHRIASLYELARYSDHPISPKDADDVRKSAGI